MAPRSPDPRALLLVASLLLAPGARAQVPGFGDLGAHGGRPTSSFHVDEALGAEELLSQAEGLLEAAGEGLRGIARSADRHDLAGDRTRGFSWDRDAGFQQGQRAAALARTRLDELRQLLPVALTKAQAAGLAVQARAVAAVTRYDLLLDGSRKKTLTYDRIGPLNRTAPLGPEEATYLRAPEAPVSGGDPALAQAAVGQAQELARAAAGHRQQLETSLGATLRTRDASVYQDGLEVASAFGHQMELLKAARNRALFLVQAAGGAGSQEFSRLESQYRVLAAWGDRHHLEGPSGRRAGLFLEGVDSHAGEAGGHGFEDSWLLGDASPSRPGAGGPRLAAVLATATAGFQEDPEAAQVRASAREAQGSGGPGPGPAADRPGSRPARVAGQVENPITDEAVDEVLRGARSIHEVYEAFGNLLAAVYPARSPAGQVIQQFRRFLRDLRWKLRPGGATGADTVEMPMPIDDLMAILRAERPDAGANVKAQLYTAVLLPVLQLRGITYRLRPLIDRSFSWHTQAINQLRAWKLNLGLSGGETAEAFFEFFTYPMAAREGMKIQFHTASDLQDWLLGNLVPTLGESIALVEVALGRMKPGQHESLDLSVMTQGPQPFPDAGMEAGVRRFEAAEVHHLLAGLYWLRGLLRAACLYDLDDYVAMSNAGTDRLLQSFLLEKVPFGQKPRKGFPASERVAVVEDFGKLFVRKRGNLGPPVLADARAGWAQYKQAMSGYLAARPSRRDDRMANVGWFQAGRRDYELRFRPRVDGMLAGPYQLAEFVGGTLTAIDLPGLLSNPPPDLHDFLPRDFSQGEAGAHYRDFEFSSGAIAYSDYGHGNPVGWKLDRAPRAWGRLFPGLSNQVEEGGRWVEPYRAVHRVSRSYVGYLLTPWLSLLVY